MRGQHLARPDAGDPVPLVQGHVQAEGRGAEQGDLPLLLVDRVALQHAEGGVGMGDHPRPVVGEHGAQSGQTGHGWFWAAGEAGEEMRLYEAGEDADAGLQVQAVEVDRGAAAAQAQVGQRGVVAGVVVDHLVSVGDLGPEHPVQLFRGIGAVGARRHQDGDLFARQMGQLGQQGWQHAVAWHRAGAVVHHDHHVVACIGQGGQRGGAERVPKCIEDRGMLVRQSGHVDRLDHLDVPIGEFHLESGPAIGQQYLHSTPPRNARSIRRSR